MKPVLVVMAAGLGSRYGGLKQIDRIGPNDEIILELSVYDAIKAGFEEVVFIVRKEIIEDFKELIGNKLENFIKVTYVLQDINNLPNGYEVPIGRTKPWGTGHAILSVKDVVKSPFVVINADDYYGRESFKLMFEFLDENTKDNYHSMVGYQLKNTLSEHGHVARGICSVVDGNLKEVIERTKIIKKDNQAFYTENDQDWISLDINSIASMNMWGFMNSIFNEVEVGFINFLESDVKANPLKCEYFIPSIVSNIINENSARIKVMSSTEKWYGVTYQEDKELVRDAIRCLIEAGLYPENLWKGFGDNEK